MIKHLKPVLLRVLPSSLTQRIRVWRAPHVAAHYTDADWPLSRIVRALIQPGDRVLDVGANMGYITTRLADYVGTTGRVVALEPVPQTYAMLYRTVTHLGLKQVQALHAGASDQTGSLKMEIPAYKSGGENLYESRILEPSATATGHVVNVRVVRLDDVVQDERGHVSFAKIDVEGHELAALRGAQDWLRRDQPALLIEVSGDPDDSRSPAATLLTDLATLGYRAWWWDEAHLRVRRAGDKSVDYFFLTPTHEQLLRDRGIQLAHGDKD